MKSNLYRKNLDTRSFGQGLSDVEHSGRRKKKKQSKKIVTHEERLRRREEFVQALADDEAATQSRTCGA